MTNRTTNLRDIYPPPERGTGNDRLDPFNAWLEKKLADDGDDMPSRIKLARLRKLYENEELEAAQARAARESLTSPPAPQGGGTVQQQPLENSLVKTIFEKSMDALSSDNVNLRAEVRSLMELAKKPPAPGDTVTVHPPAEKPKSDLEVMKEKLGFLDDVINFATSHGLVVKPGTITPTGASGVDQLALLKHEREMLQMKFDHELALHRLSREEAARDNALQVELAKVTGRRKVIQDIRGAIIDGCTALGAEASSQLRKNKGSSGGSMHECPDCHQNTVYIPKGAGKGLLSCTNPECGSQFHQKPAEG